MSVYVTSLEPRTPSPRKPWDRGCRLVADTPEELHAFAFVKLRLRQEWADRRGPQLSYEISPGQRVIAVRSGAIDLVSREMARGLMAEGDGDLFKSGAGV